MNPTEVISQLHYVNAKIYVSVKLSDKHLLSGYNRMLQTLKKSLKNPPVSFINYWFPVTIILISTLFSFRVLCTAQGHRYCRKVTSSIPHAVI